MLHLPQTAADAPWKERFRALGILGAQSAPASPGRGVVFSAPSGEVQIYAWDIPSGRLAPLTDRPGGLWQGLLSPDGRYLYYLEDQGGNEIGHYVRRPWEGGPAQDLTPAMAPYSAVYQPAVSRSGTLFGFTPVDSQGFHLDCLDLYPNGTFSAPRRLYSTSKLAQDLVLSAGGEIAVLATTERSAARQYSLLAFATVDGARLGELWDGPAGSLRPVQFAPIAGDTRLLAMTNQTGANRPVIWNPRTGERTDLALAELSGEVLPWDWSPAGDRLLLCQIDQARQQLYIYELATGALRRVSHPGGTYCRPGAGGPWFGPAGEIFALWEDSIHPPQVIALAGPAGVGLRVVLAGGNPPPGRPLESITFRSSDGQEIQGWLGRPEGPGPFPTILETHGGPHIAESDSFAPLSQAWIDHGYAYLTINYRGSTTFGRSFQEQIWGDMGHWEVEDMVAARDWLIAQGIARPDAVLLTGASYGGYLTLLALGRYPDRWAGGLAVVADADLTLSYADASETFRGWLVAMMGGTPEEKPEQYQVSSPLTYVDQVQAPVLIIQGRNDTRCPARPIEVFESRLRARGRPIEVHWFEAGHGSGSLEQIFDFQERMLRFAYACLAPAASARPPTGQDGEAIGPCPNCGAPMNAIRGSKQAVCANCGFKDSCCY